MKRKDAIDILFGSTPTDYILDSHETPDFFEFNVSCGGDVCTYRIYKNSGTITQKQVS